eukprot:607069-Pelagomonas_calceolata.AAC.3
MRVQHPFKKIRKIKASGVCGPSRSLKGGVCGPTVTITHPGPSLPYSLEAAPFPALIPTHAPHPHLICNFTPILEPVATMNLIKNIPHCQEKLKQRQIFKKPHGACKVAPFWTNLLCAGSSSDQMKD